MLKCVWQPCSGEVEYIYFGKSLCRHHFKVTVEEVVEADKRTEETVKKRST